MNSRIVIPQAPNIKIDALKGDNPDNGPAWFNFYTKYYQRDRAFGSLLKNSEEFRAKTFDQATIKSATEALIKLVVTETNKYSDKDTNRIIIGGFG